jgi:hypothetical protein
VPAWRACSNLHVPFILRRSCKRRCAACTRVCHNGTMQPLCLENFAILNQYAMRPAALPWLADCVQLPTMGNCALQIHNTRPTGPPCLALSLLAATRPSLPQATRSYQKLRMVLAVPAGSCLPTLTHTKAASAYYQCAMSHKRCPDLQVNKPAPQIQQARAQLALSISPRTKRPAHLYSTQLLAQTQNGHYLAVATLYSQGAQNRQNPARHSVQANPFHPGSL